MEYNRRHLGTNSQGNTTRIEEKETQAAGNIKKQQSQESGQKKHNNHRYKKTNAPITNLSNYKLLKHQIILLTKGLNFIPTPRKDHPAKTLQDISFV